MIFQKSQGARCAPLHAKTEGWNAKARVRIAGLVCGGVEWDVHEIGCGGDFGSVGCWARHPDSHTSRQALEVCGWRSRDSESEFCAGTEYECCSHSKGPLAEGDSSLLDELQRHADLPVVQRRPLRGGEMQSERNQCNKCLLYCAQGTACPGHRRGGRTKKGRYRGAGPAIPRNWTPLWARRRSCAASFSVATRVCSSSGKEMMCACKTVGPHLHGLVVGSRTDPDITGHAPGLSKVFFVVQRPLTTAADVFDRNRTVTDWTTEKQKCTFLSSLVGDRVVLADFAIRTEEYASVLSHDGQSGAMLREVANLDKDIDTLSTFRRFYLERAASELGHPRRLSPIKSGDPCASGAPMLTNCWRAFCCKVVQAAVRGGTSGVDSVPHNAEAHKERYWTSSCCHDVGTGACWAGVEVRSSSGVKTASMRVMRHTDILERFLGRPGGQRRSLFVGHLIPWDPGA